jgi:GTP-binding protein EngB required for normal cell division
MGKSSIINSVVGAPVAETGKYKSTTKEIKRWDAKYREAEMVLIDTPGFGDDGWNWSNDDRYLALIEREVGEIDLVLYVSKLDDTRVHGDEIDTLHALTRKFGRELWDRAVVVLTFADRFTRREYREELAGRSAVLREAMEKVIGDRARRIPFVPVTNVRERNPDRSRWMATLWLAMMERVGQRGFDAFVLSTISRLTSEDAPEEGEPFPSSRSIPAPAKPRRRKGAAVAPAPAPVPAPRPATTPVVATPTAVVPAGTPATTTRSYVSDGVPVQQTTINIGAGIANITVNTGEIEKTKDVIGSRASSGLLQKLKTAGSWIATGAAVILKILLGS